MWNDFLTWVKGLFGNVADIVVEEAREFVDEVGEAVSEEVVDSLKDAVDNEKGSVDGELFGAGLGIMLLLTLLAAWVTHVVTCFKDEAWGFLIAGAIAAPVAWVHGFGLWFGWWS